MLQSKNILLQRNIAETAFSSKNAKLTLFGEVLNIMKMTCGGACALKSFS